MGHLPTEQGNISQYGMNQLLHVLYYMNQLLLDIGSLSGMSEQISVQLPFLHVSTRVFPVPEPAGRQAVAEELRLKAQELYLGRDSSSGFRDRTGLVGSDLGEFQVLPGSGWRSRPSRLPPEVWIPMGFLPSRTLLGSGWLGVEDMWVHTATEPPKLKFNLLYLLGC